jgi:7,8-dihydropterin-6-yl-methyl-4-(beta-D-ribofuranosyl)aminobenzene 5'-phosphate synthase
MEGIMNFRLSPLWWPILAVFSPLLAPFLIKKNRLYKQNLTLVKQLNEERMQRAEPLELPELDHLDVTVVVEEKAEEGFKGDAGVCYLFRSNLGSLLYDVSFGPDRPALAYNAERLGINLDQIDGLCISHLHPDHMGGLKASREKRVMIPEKLGKPSGQPCFVPDKAEADGFACEVVDSPRMLTGGIATTGPLARSLFFFGKTEEQALIARVKDKGLVIFTGCGHPTIEVIVQMARVLSDEPVHAIGGGLHYPVTGGRGNRLGIQIQTIVGTGKPVWERITDEDLDRTLANLEQIKPQAFFPSAHDTCDHALSRMEKELTTETEVLEAGKTYRF